VNAKLAWTHVENTSVYTKKTLSQAVAEALACTAYIEAGLSVIFILSLKAFGIIKESQRPSKSEMLEEEGLHAEDKTSWDDKFAELEYKLQDRLDTQLDKMQRGIANEISSQLTSQTSTTGVRDHRELQGFAKPSQPPGVPEVSRAALALENTQEHFDLELAHDQPQLSSRQPQLSARVKPQLSARAKPQLSARAKPLFGVESNFDQPFPPEITPQEVPETPEGPNPRPQVRVNGKPGMKSDVATALPVKIVGQVGPQQVPPVKTKAMVKQRAV